MRIEVGSKQLRRHFAALSGLLVIQTVLIAWSACRHGPGYDEPAHIASGITHWREGRYRAYRVNPHLVRMIATVPAMIMGEESFDVPYRTSPGNRPEFDLGRTLMVREGTGFFRLLAICRLACLPFAWTGTIVCFLWGSHLFGRRAGIFAAALWCFSPNILAHSQLVMPDAPAAATGLAACYAFSRWLDRPTWYGSALAGILLGIALLTKSTWIVLLLVWPLLGVGWLYLSRRVIVSPRTFMIQLATIGAVGLVSFNAAYRFQGTLRQLGDYEFVSRSLSGIPTETQQRGVRPTGNRFRGTVWERVPVPLPGDFVQGIDEQKWDFERGRPAYIAGTTYRSGKWYFYLYAAAVKLPLGTVLLLGLAVTVGAAALGKCRADARLVPLLLPPLAVLSLVSSQTGINQHFRYALPAFPFFFVAASCLMRTMDGKTRRCLRMIAIVLLLAVAAETVSVYPHTFSFFHVAAGGPERGYSHLGIPSTDSNFDWGLDVTYLYRWATEHPEARPLFVDVDSVMPLEVLGIGARDVEIDDPLKPGWYAISVSALVRRRNYGPFRKATPVRQFGYTIRLYRVGPSTSNESSDRSEH